MAFALKYDGYRMQGAGRNGQATLRTRRGLDWSLRFPAGVDAVAKLNARSAVVDGELVVMDREERSSFRELQQFLQNGGTGRLVYVLFDLLTLDGEDLRELPFSVRRQRLRALLGRQSKTSVVRLSELLSRESAPDTLLRTACSAGFEGAIGKRLDSSYASGRSRSWVKLKCGQRQEFVVVGYTLPRGSRVGIGALLLAVHEDDESKGKREHKRGAVLRYAGAVGTGFSDAVLRALRAALDALGASAAPR